jgi:opacity protein-like surface antigen
MPDVRPVRWLYLLALAAALALAAPAQAQKKSDLTGSTWSGRENLAGYGALTFEFEEGGSVTMIDAKETVPGSYKRTGQNITLSFFGGQAIYSGRINGKTMSGTARNAARNWSWQVTKEGGAPPPETDSKSSAPAKPAAPATPQELEAKAAELLQQAKQAISAGNSALARVRLRLIVTEYPLTKAAKEAKQLLDKMAK